MKGNVQRTRAAARLDTWFRTRPTCARRPPARPPARPAPRVPLALADRVVLGADGQGAKGSVRTEDGARGLSPGGPRGKSGGERKHFHSFFCFIF